MRSFNYIKSTHPGWHVVGVGVAVVVVEDEDGQHHAARHHPLDEVEVGPCNVAVNKSCKNRFLNVEAFNKDKALVEALTMIVKTLRVVSM